MADKKYKPAKVPKSQSALTVGYSRLPSRTREGSTAHFAKIYSAEARQSMAGVLANFQKLIDSVKQITPEALEETLAPTFEKSQVYCPVKTGALVASARMENGMNTRGQAFCRISYGDEGAIHYAAIVHERTDFHHAHPTRAKYLQSAVEEDMGNLRSRFIAAVRNLTR